MKNKKRYIIPLAVLSATCMAAAVGCSTDYVSPEYSYTNPNRDVTPHEKDPEFTLDGKLDEGFWQQSRWLQSYKASNPLVNYKATSWIGEKGLYMAFDVNDPTVYVNPDRSVYINSGIELYLSDNSAEAMTTGFNHAYEVELSADGKTSNVTKWGPSGYKGAWQEQFDFAVTPKGGAVNTSECTGYVMEAFFPNRMFGATEKMDAVRANIAILSTIDYTSNARDWWNSGEQDIGCIWGTPASWYEFGADGLHGAFDVTFTASENVSISGKISALRGKSYTATFTPAAGYAVSKVTCNGVDVTNKLTYTATAVQYTTIANEDLTFAAEAVEITEGNKTLSGTVKLHQNGKLIVDSSVTATLTEVATGTMHALTVGADGSFSIGDLPQGLYTLNLKKEGFGEQSYTVMLNRDVTVDYLLEAKSLFVKQENGWDISTQNDGYITLLQGGYTGLEFAEKYGDFLFETKFREINHVAGKDCPRNQLRVQFSDDNYITFDLMHTQRDGLLHLISFGGDNGGNYMYPWQVHYT
ncbi:MAG: carboxypeptidase-like regulatory domain-containing protein, partial [Clostridiales bacterium]|nr:carboxypeptidase-like regulatory domain-containing protein [Clostridiales bacterium]